MPQVGERSIVLEIRTPRVFIGVDPGASGGLVALVEEAFGGKVVGIDKVPMHDTERDVFEWFQKFECHKAGYLFANIEWIHPAIQGIGKSQMSKLYGSYMALRMALIASGIPFSDVKPQVWQRSFGIPPRKGMGTTDWKNLLKAKAQQLFPQETVTLKTADALLIAEYCRRNCVNFNGELGKPLS